MLILNNKIGMKNRSKDYEFRRFDTLCSVGTGISKEMYEQCLLMKQSI